VSEKQTNRVRMCVVREGERERECVCVYVNFSWCDDGAAVCNSWALAVSMGE